MIRLWTRTRKSSNLTQSRTKTALCFFHIPKTGGQSLKAVLENQFAAQECLVNVPDEVSSEYQRPSDVDRRFVSGHFGENVFRLVEGTHWRTTLLRHPVERFCSQALHWMRHHQLSASAELSFASAQAAVDALLAREPLQFQNHYLCLALGKAPIRKGRCDHWLVRSRDLDAFDHVGIADRPRKMLHVLCHRFNWPPAPFHWRLNQMTNREQLWELADLIVPHLSLLDDDMETYRLAEQRFEGEYRAMLQALFPEVSDFEGLTDELVETRLLRRFKSHIRERNAVGTDDIRWDMSSPAFGTGWWWRENNGKLAYRWLGPEKETVAYLPPLRTGRTYGFDLDIVAFASPRVYGEFSICIGDHVCKHSLREVSQDPQAVKWVASGVIPRNALPEDGEPLEFRIRTPETLPVLSQYQLEHSQSTTAYDTRDVSLAIAGLRIGPQ